MPHPSQTWSWRARNPHTPEVDRTPPQVTLLAKGPGEWQRNETMGLDNDHSTGTPGKLVPTWTHSSKGWGEPRLATCVAVTGTPKPPLRWCPRSQKKELGLSSPPHGNKPSSHLTVGCRQCREPGFPHPRGRNKAPLPQPIALVSGKSSQNVRTFFITNRNEATPPW